MAQTTIERYPLEQTKVIKKTVGGILTWLIIALIVLVPAHMFVFSRFSALIIILDVLVALRVIIEPIYQYYYYKMYFYDVRTDFLVIRKGVITPRETILNYNKLQDVYVDQDILDRIFGLWDVHVSTATAMSGAEAHIDGVNEKNATAIRELLLSRIKQR
ncbi:MAG: PH domain-containing protein [Nanoarchaeota archaeon]